MGSFFRFDPAKLGEAIHATGLSVPAFARAAGVNHGTVEKAVRGERVHIGRAVVIVQAAQRLSLPEGQSLLALQASSRSA